MRILTLPCPLAYRRWRACSGSIWCGSRSCESYRHMMKGSPQETSPRDSTYPARQLSGISALSKTKTSCTRTRQIAAVTVSNTWPTGRSSQWLLTTSEHTFFQSTSSATTILVPRLRKDNLLHTRLRVAIFEIVTPRYGGTMAGRKEIPDRAKKPIALRLRTPVDAVVKARADKLGMPWGEYCSYLIANAVDMPEFAPDLPESDDPQEELPLKTA